MSTLEMTLLLNDAVSDTDGTAMTTNQSIFCIVFVVLMIGVSVYVVNKMYE